MGKKIALATLAFLTVLAAVVAAIASRPAVRSAERSAHVEAAPEVVLAQITDPRRWIAWSPWEGRDRDVRRTYGGPAEGAGASYYWSGNDRVGRGRLTIVRVTAEQVDVELEMERPLTSLSDLEFRLAAEGAGTRLTWRVTRETGDLKARVRALLARLDKALEEDLEKGIARLKGVAEAQGKVERWRVERSARMEAPPAAVLAQIVDLRRWTAWSPWEGLDPKVNRTYAGPPGGAGSSYYWSGNEAAGRGRLTLIRSAAEKVEIEIAIDAPRESLADIEFGLAPDGAGTRVTWAVSGEVEVVGETLGRAGSPDATLGAELERGLAGLSAAAGAQAGANAAR